MPSLVLLAGSGDVWVATVVAFLTRNSGIWILIFAGTSDEIALFGVAQRLVVPVLLPLSVAAALIGPIAATLAEKSEWRDLQSALRFATSVSTYASAAVALLLVVAGPFILHWVFGSFYTDSYPLVLALIVGALWSVASGSPGITLIMSGHQRLFSLASVLYGMLTLGLGLLAYYAGGLMALAVTMSVVTIARFLTMSALVWRTTGMIVYPEMRRQSIRETVDRLGQHQGATHKWGDR